MEFFNKLLGWMEPVIAADTWRFLRELCSSLGGITKRNRRLVVVVDFLVKLYDLPDFSRCREALGSEGVAVRRALSSEKHLVIDWVLEHFGPGWSSECEVAFGTQPLTCFVAVKDQSLIGFSCFDATLRGFFGPLGVLECERGCGVGKGLLLSTLNAMAAAGYGYAVVGGVTEVEFYSKVLDIVEIPGSSPGIYNGQLRYGISK